MQTMKITMLSCVVALGSAGCADIQVKRDLLHADTVAQYQVALERAGQFDPRAACKPAPALKTWIPFVLDASTPVVELPSGVAGTAICIAIPEGASVIEYHSDSSGGAIYHGHMIMYPSLQFLDEAYSLVQDFPKPRLTVEETWTTMALKGMTVLKGDLAEARYAVVYAHPASLDGEIDLSGAVIPYVPYGRVKLRFHPTPTP